MNNKNRQKEELFQQLKDEINNIRKEHRGLKDDAAFVYWFLKAYITDSEEMAFKSLTGISRDKSIDGILIDDKARQVHIIQGKLHQSLGTSGEKRNDILSFARLSNLPWENKEYISAFYTDLDPLAKQKVEEMISCVRRKKYNIFLYYVTTGRCVSNAIWKEAKSIVRHSDAAAEIFIYDAMDVITIFKDYLSGVAPAIPSLSLRIASEGAVRTEGTIHRYDPRKEIDSYVFSMSSEDVGEMYEKAGVRLFARNIRGYLGNTDINEAMADTVENEPHNFWYYNNGVTMVCDEVRRESQKGQDILIVERPQVINGQQTTRTLYERCSKQASVLVRVIRIARSPGDDDEYDTLVSAIVRATNWQNAIKTSDLVSNDYKQVFLERELRKIGYQYIRKRQSKSEARRLFGSRGFYQVKKDELAQAVAASMFDPVLVRKGKEGLFEEQYYKSIFGSNSVPFYLSNYWLMCQVQYVASGHPGRYYAKWVVLNFAWKKLSKQIESGRGERLFRYACEADSNTVLSPLYSALISMFRGALMFYRSERGRGEEAKDVSTFFQRTKLDHKFARFWLSSKNSYRKPAENALKKFRTALKEVEISE